MLVLLTLAGKPAAAEDKAPAPDDPRFPAYVLDKIDDMYRGRKSHGIMDMNVKTKHWTRTMSMETWSLGKDHSLVRILKPRKEKGTATLKSKKDLFIYLNKTSRTIKITSGMLGGSWMGSHFTNDDLMRESRMARDFDIKLSFKGAEGGVPVYRFTCKAKADAVVVWDKIVTTVRQSDLLALRQEFYDEGGKKMRLLEFSDHAKMSGRLLPLKMKMTPLDKHGEYTAVVVKKMDFNTDLNKSFFSLQKLRSR